MIKKNKNWVYYSLIIIGFVFIFLASSVIYRIYNIDILPFQFFGALISVFITVIVMVILLREQTQGDEEREKSVKVFEKKQEVYHAFLEKFKKIIQDGDIKVGVKKEDGTIDYTTDELKDLIFQLAFIQMHTSTENTKEILMYIADIKEILSDFSITNYEEKQKKQGKFYSDLSTKLFKIVAILKADLYSDNEAGVIPTKEMEDVLEKFKLYVEVKDSDKYEMQNYFLAELQNQLKQKGYKIKQKDFRKDVSAYYSRIKNRHRYYGIEFPLNINGEDARFRIEIDNNYFYGFIRPEKNKKNPKLEKIIKQDSSFKQSEWWYGYKFSDRYGLDFWTLNSPEFDRLKDTRKREQLIIDIANEIDIYINSITNK